MEYLLYGPLQARQVQVLIVFVKELVLEYVLPSDHIPASRPLCSRSLALFGTISSLIQHPNSIPMMPSCQPVPSQIRNNVADSLAAHQTSPLSNGCLLWLLIIETYTQET